ncbi:hypothetical protein FC652_07925 [Vibrio sp. 05-20-BW147]|nr:hypothetical protein [Vibrio sp. 05-20-BW147]
MTLIARLNFMSFIYLTFLISAFFQDNYSLTDRIKTEFINSNMKLILLTLSHPRPPIIAVTIWRF